MESDPFGVDDCIPLPAFSRAAGLDGVARSRLFVARIR
jgi:hypothetical protein